MLPLPEPYLLEAKVLTDFISPRDKNYPLTESWDKGGVALNDTSEGLSKYEWFAWTDGEHIYLKREDLEEVTVLVNDIDITEIDITFDQSMRICLAYVSNNQSKLLWYDTVTAKSVITLLGDNDVRPRVCLDDKRTINAGNSDIILAYQRNNSLYFRLQRDRYSIEYLLATDLEVQRFLWRIGMGRESRFLFYWR